MFVYIWKWSSAHALGGIFHYHWWTASIKPRLLFSHSGLVSWGLPFLQFAICVCFAYGPFCRGALKACLLCLLHFISEHLCNLLAKKCGSVAIFILWNHLFSLDIQFRVFHKKDNQRIYYPNEMLMRCVIIWKSTNSSVHEYVHRHQTTKLGTHEIKWLHSIRIYIFHFLNVQTKRYNYNMDFIIYAIETIC